MSWLRPLRIRMRHSTPSSVIGLRRVRQWKEVKIKGGGRRKVKGRGTKIPCSQREQGYHFDLSRATIN